MDKWPLILAAIAEKVILKSIEVMANIKNVDL